MPQAHRWAERSSEASTLFSKHYKADSKRQCFGVFLRFLIRSPEPLCFLWLHREFSSCRVMNLLFRELCSSLSANNSSVIVCFLSLVVSRPARPKFVIHKLLNSLPLQTFSKLKSWSQNLLLILPQSKYLKEKFMQYICCQSTNHHPIAFKSSWAFHGNMSLAWEEFCWAFNDSANSKFGSKSSLLCSLVKAFWIHGSPQAQQSQISL